MIIIVGTRTRKRKLGRVAEYCPTCREIRPCRVTQIESIFHLYFIPLSRAKIKGHIVECDQCRQRVSTHIDVFTGFSHNRNDTLDDLIAETNPDLEARLIRRLELAERAAGGDISPEERLELLNAPFLAIAAAVEGRVAQMHADRQSGWLILALAVAALGFFLSLGFVRPGALRPMLLYASGIAGAIIFIALIWSLATEPRRFIKRRYGPLIIESLADLHPTREELRTVLRALRARRLVVGRKISADWVLAQLALFEHGQGPALEPGAGPEDAIDDHEPR
jgi:hypothetical protein